MSLITSDYVMLSLRTGMFVHYKYCTSLSVLSVILNTHINSLLSCLTFFHMAHSVLLTVVGRPSEFSGSNYGGNYGNHGQSLPIPVPTQVQNYQRMEQNLHSTKQDGSPWSVSTNIHAQHRQTHMHKFHCSSCKFVN